MKSLISLGVKTDVFRLLFPYDGAAHHDVIVDCSNKLGEHQHNEQSHQPGQLRRRQAPQSVTTIASDFEKRIALTKLMANKHMSEGVKRFIREKIQTVPRLEVLLLLHREQARLVTLEEVTKQLGCEDDTARDQLTALELIGLVETNSDKSQFRYHPANETQASIVDRLAIAYKKQRVPILSAILAKEPDKVRRFAEAFRLARTNAN